MPYSAREREGNSRRERNALPVKGKAPAASLTQLMKEKTQQLHSACERKASNQSRKCTQAKKKKATTTAAAEEKARNAF